MYLFYVLIYCRPYLASLDHYSVLGANRSSVSSDSDNTSISQIESVAKAAVTSAENIGAKLIIVLTASGDTSRMVAKYRPSVPVMSFCSTEKVGRQLQIHRGIYPIALRSNLFQEYLFEARPKEALRYIIKLIHYFTLFCFIIYVCKIIF